MKKKWKSLSLLLLLAAVLLAGCAGSDPKAETDGDSPYPKITLTCAGLDSDDTAKAHDLRLFMDLVKEKSGGRITFNEYWNASLGKSETNLDIIRNGIADVGTVCTLYTPSQLPLSQIAYCVPFTPNDPALAGKLMYEISAQHPEFYKEYEKNNVVNLAWKGNEPYKLYMKNPIQSISDLDGKKITMGGVYYIPWFESQGAVPVTAAAPDLYQTIKTGVASGSFVYDSIYTNYKLYEVEDYCFEISLGARNCDTICFNKDTWDSFNEETRKLLQECADQAMGDFQVWQQKQMDGYVKEMKENGVVFTKITDQDKKRWAEEALDFEDTIKSWINDADKAGYNGAEIMSDYLKAAENLGFAWAFDADKYILD